MVHPSLSLHVTLPLNLLVLFPLPFLLSHPAPLFPSPTLPSLSAIFPPSSSCFSTFLPSRPSAMSPPPTLPFLSSLLPVFINLSPPGPTSLSRFSTTSHTFLPSSTTSHTSFLPPSTASYPSLLPLLFFNLLSGSQAIFLFPPSLPHSTFHFSLFPFLCNLKHILPSLISLFHLVPNSSSSIFAGVTTYMNKKKYPGSRLLSGSFPRV